jgi:hypothetical protein
MKRGYNQKQKKFLFWSLVLFVMVLIIFLRVIKKSSFNNIILEEKTNNSLDWQSFSKKFNSILNDFDDDWNEVKNEKKSKVKNIFIENIKDSTSTEATSTNVLDIEKEKIVDDEEENIENNYQDIEKLKDDMDNLKEKFINVNNCPEWINCMPMIGVEKKDRKDCVIPKGCEGITQIAY